MKKKFLAISGITLLGGVLVYATKRLLEFKEEMDMVDEIEEKDELIESLADDVSYVNHMHDIDIESPITLTEDCIKELYKIHEHLSVFICFIDKFETVSIIQKDGKDLVHIKMDIRTIKSEEHYTIDMVTDNFKIMDLVETEEENVMYSVVGVSPRICNDYSEIDMPTKFFVPVQISKVPMKTVILGSVKAKACPRDPSDMPSVVDRYATKNDLEDINTTLNALSLLVEYIPHIKYNKEWINGTVNIVYEDLDEKSTEISYMVGGTKYNYVLVFDYADQKRKACELIRSGDVSISGSMGRIDSRGRIVLWSVSVRSSESPK